MSEFPEIGIDRDDLEREINVLYNNYNALIRVIKIYQDVEEDISLIGFMGSATQKQVEIVTENLSRYYRKVNELSDIHSRITFLMCLYEKYFGDNDFQSMNKKRLEDFLERNGECIVKSQNQMLGRLSSNFSKSLADFYRR